HHAYTGRVLWDHLVEIPEAQVGEAEAHGGDVLGLLNATVYFGRFELQSPLPHFGPLLERAASRKGEVGVKAIDIGNCGHPELCAYVASQLVVELLFRSGPVIC